MTERSNYNYTPKRIFQYLAVGTGCLGTASSGMHYGWSSPSIPKLLQSDSPVSITNEESSWVAVTLLFGTFCGAHLATEAVDRIGRKKTQLLTAVLSCISWIIIAFASSIFTLILARFIAGLADGVIFSVLPMYIGEISDPKIRGFLGSWMLIPFVVGILMMNNIGSSLSISTTAFVSLSVPLVTVLPFCWMPESPYYLIMKGNIEQARKNLRILWRNEDIEGKLSKLTEAVELQNTNIRKYFDLFSVKSNRRALYIMIGLRTAQQFSGVTAIMFYSQTIFKEIGTVVSPSTCSTIYFVSEIILISLSSIIIDKIGRRPLLIISLSGVSIALFVAGCYFHVKESLNIDISSYSCIPLATLIVFVSLFSIGIHPIPIIIKGELFPTNVKAFAMSICCDYYCIVTAVAPKFFQMTKDRFGIHVPFFVFSACSIFGLIFVILVVPETKGKTLEEIQEELGNNFANIKLDERKTMVKKE